MAKGLTWTMRDGTEIAVGEMGDKHLMRSYKMVARQIPPPTLWVSILHSEIKKRGLQQHPMARLTKDEAANVYAMLEAEYSEWESWR